MKQQQGETKLHLSFTKECKEYIESEEARRGTSTVVAIAESQYRS